MPATFKIVKIKLLSIAIIGMARLSCSAADLTLLDDDFKGPSINPGLWHIPAWRSSGDGTFIGRTQLRTAQHSGSPEIVSGSVVLPVQTYNPANPAAPSFWGAELISNQAFSVGLDVIVRARMSTAKRPGIVGGIFLYSLRPGSDSLHDEIDFELLTSDPGQVQTNIYANEPLGIGHVQLIPYRTGSVADEHTYEMRWTKTSVSWVVDGQLVRSTTEHIPTEPMNLYLNTWVPDPAWARAYSPDIQPTAMASSNEVLASLRVGSVTIRSLNK